MVRAAEASSNGTPTCLGTFQQQEEQPPNSRGCNKHANCVEVSLCDLFDSKILYEEKKPGFLC